MNIEITQISKNQYFARRLVNQVHSTAIEIWLFKGLEVLI